MGIFKNMVNDRYSDLINLHEKQYVISQIRSKKRYAGILEFLFSNSDMYTVGNILTAYESENMMIIDGDEYEIVWLGAAIDWIKNNSFLYEMYKLSSLNPINNIEHDIVNIMVRLGYEFDIESQKFFKIRNTALKDLEPMATL